MSLDPKDAITRVDAVAAQLGIPQHVADMAKEVLRDGQDCDRCRRNCNGDELMTMFAFTATTPMMPDASPPTILCQECGYRTAAFMGIQAAQRKVNELFGG